MVSGVGDCVKNIVVAERSNANYTKETEMETVFCRDNIDVPDFTSCDIKLSHQNDKMSVCKQSF